MLIDFTKNCFHQFIGAFTHGARPGLMSMVYTGANMGLLPAGCQSSTPTISRSNLLACARQMRYNSVRSKKNYCHDCSFFQANIGMDPRSGRCVRNPCPPRSDP
jgi:hypothetical protein